MTAPSSDPNAYGDFIFNYLLRPLPPIDGATRAVTETEHPAEGDNWFWADDNAKVLELIASPAIWRKRPQDVEDILKFVCALCDGPFIFRRIAAARLEAVRDDADALTLIHGLMDVHFDRTAGKVDLGMRFHDGRTARNMRFAGNYVRFRHDGHDYMVAVEGGLVGSSVDLHSNHARLAWTSEIMFDAVGGLFRKSRRMHLGLLTYTATVRAGSMFVDFEVSLDLDPAVSASEVVLSFAFDDLSLNTNNARYENVMATLKGGRVRRLAPDQRELAIDGADYWCVTQRSQIAGFALAVHSLPQGGARPSKVEVTRRQDGALHWVAAEYAFAGPQRGRLAVAEKKIITSGGFYDATDLYAATLKRYAAVSHTSQSPIDLSISYDYGAELRAFAKCYRTLGEINAPNQRSLRIEMKELVHRVHDAYRTYFVKPFDTNPAAIFSRSIAFMAFAYADMLAATNEDRYRIALREACDIIMTFERRNEGIAGIEQSGFRMGRDVDSPPYFDCHCSCLLALARSSAMLGEDAWIEAIDRGLAAFRYDTIEIFFVEPQKQDTIGVDYLMPDGTRRTLDSFWNFNAGLGLRLFNELRATQHHGVAKLWARHVLRLEPMERFMRDQIARSIRPRDIGLEIRTSILSSETNSETQPWVALALIGEN